MADRTSVTTMMQVRRLELADLDDWLEVRHEALVTSPSAFASSPEDDRGSDRAHMSQQLAARGDDDAIFGAWSNDRLLGVAGFHRDTHRKLRHRAMLWGMFVREGARGRGVGRALVTAVVQHAEQVEGLLDLHLGVAAGNDPARALYERCGFRAWAVDERALIVDGMVIDEVLMRRAV